MAVTMLCSHRERVIRWLLCSYPEVNMNPFNVITLAALYGALAQPAVMAQEFIAQPAPVIGKAHASDAVSQDGLERFAHELSTGKQAVLKLTEQADIYYSALINASPDDARAMVVANGAETTEACEIFLRAFEIEVKKIVEQSDLPAFVATEMRSYWRIVAKARSTVTRLNKFTKSLIEVPKVFEGSTNLEHLRVLASMTTEKLGSMSFH
ncbi:TPA: hypothetical protein ACF54C_004925 [Serratia marcescens]